MTFISFFVQLEASELLSPSNNRFSLAKSIHAVTALSFAFDFVCLVELADDPSAKVGIPLIFDRIHGIHRVHLLSELVALSFYVHGDVGEVHDRASRAKPPLIDLIARRLRRIQLLRHNIDLLQAIHDLLVRQLVILLLPSNQDILFIQELIGLGCTCCMPLSGE